MTENSFIPIVYNNGNRTWEIGSYLHRFGLTDNPMCPCEEEQATECKKLRNERDEMRKQINTLVAFGLPRMQHGSVIIHKLL